MDHHRREATDQEPHPGEPPDMPETGDHADEREQLRDRPVTRTTMESVIRRRKFSWRLTRIRAASRGIAAEKAITQTFADQSRVVAVRKGCIRTKPMAISPP